MSVLLQMESMTWLNEWRILHKTLKLHTGKVIQAKLAKMFKLAKRQLAKEPRPKESANDKYSLPVRMFLGKTLSKLRTTMRQMCRQLMVNPIQM